MGRRKNGLGWIKVLPDGRYRMRQRVGVNDNGVPKILTVTGKTEAECIKKMRKKSDPYVNGITGKGSDYLKKATLTELCNLHLQEHMNQKDRLKPKSTDRREGTIRNQIENYPIGRLQVPSVTPQDINGHIERLIRDGELSISSIEKVFDVINSAYKWAKSHYYTEYNPCDPVRDMIKNRLRNLKKRDTSEGVVIVLSDDQKRKIRDYVAGLNEQPAYSQLFGLSVMLLMHTGMRVGELCALRWKDWINDTTPSLSINKTRNIIKDRVKDGGGYTPNENVVKNYHSRDIALSSDANEVLAKMHSITPKKDPDDYILINRRGTPSNPSNFDANVAKFYQRAGLSEEVSGAHILRRTCATDMHNQGCRIEDIAAYLGDTPETIRKYYVAMTKKVLSDGKVLNIVPIPKSN